MRVIGRAENGLLRKSVPERSCGVGGAGGAQLPCEPPVLVLRALVAHHDRIAAPRKVRPARMDDAGGIVLVLLAQSAGPDHNLPYRRARPPAVVRAQVEPGPHSAEAV
jgi:hypothetical protein